MSIGIKIKQFEALPQQNVKEFNKLFEGSGLLADESLVVEIGEIVGPENVRRIVVGNEQMVHVFSTASSFEDLYLPHCLHTGEVAKANTARLESLNKVRAGVIEENRHGLRTNAQLENLLLTEKELELEPMEYMLLQYFRGCQSPFHTQIEIAKKVNKSVRTIRVALSKMEGKRVIKVNMMSNLHKMAVTIAEDWA